MTRKVIAADEKLSAQVAEFDTAEAQALAELEKVEAEAKTVWSEQAARDWPSASGLKRSTGRSSSAMALEISA